MKGPVISCRLVSSALLLMFFSGIASSQTVQIGCDITKCEPTWLPGFGNVTPFTARIYYGIPGEPCYDSHYPGIINFLISSNSWERGYALNKGESTHSDIHFNTPENQGLFQQVASTAGTCDLQGAHDHWWWVKTTSCVTEATVYVKSEDFGSFGSIRAWVDFAPDCPQPSFDLVTYTPREPGGPPTCTVGPTVTVIPRDDNGNDIADSWYGDASEGNTLANWDEETQPNPGSFTGDGLSRYEEYRGAYKQEVHTRFFVSTKELFVYRENPAWGPEHINTTALIHFIFADEMNGALHDPAPGTVNPNKGPRIVNFNGTTHHLHDQHGLWLSVAGQAVIRQGSWGLARDNTGGTGGAIGPPRTAGKISVYPENIRAACDPHRTARLPGGLLPRFGIRPRDYYEFFYDASGRSQEMIRDVIGHEAGHGINLPHHGIALVRARRIPPDVNDPFDPELPRGTGWYDVNGQPVNGPRHLSSAADRTCPMRYQWPEIEQSVGLRLTTFRIGELVPALWRSNDPDWIPTLPPCSAPYCAECRPQVKIKD